MQALGLKPFERFITIPAFSETSEFVQRLIELANQPTSQPFIAVIVVNCPSTANAQQQSRTNQLRMSLNQQSHRQLSIAGLPTHELILERNSRLWAIDLAQIQQGAAERPAHILDGVGFARHLGMDLGLKLYAEGLVNSPWLHSTDADALLPPNYLSTPLPNDSNTAACLYPFDHGQPEGRTRPAALLYDISLRYYVAGLAHSGSPWAYHTIGSTLAIHAEHYAMARGFPNREAGEDFYLLNKLAKTGRIVSLNTTPIILSDRPSNRVPFGTGPAVKRIEQMTDPLNEFELYNPAIFDLLKQWHRLLPELFDKNEKQACGLLHDLGDEAQEAFARLNLNKALSHCRDHARTPSAFVKHMLQWFDGFRTLKWIHYLRDSTQSDRFASLTFKDWLEHVNQGQVDFIAPLDLLSTPDPQALYPDILVSVFQQLKQREQRLLPRIQGVTPLLANFLAPGQAS